MKPPSRASEPPRVVYEGRYQRMVVRGHWEYSERTHPGGLAAIIIAVTPDDRGLFVGQFPIPLQARPIEMPAGRVGEGDGGAAGERGVVRARDGGTGRH